MEMIDRLAAVFACVDDDAIAPGEVLNAGNLGRRPKQMAEQAGVAGLALSDRHNVLARNDEHVNRSLRANVREGVAFVVLKNRRGGDASFDDAAEETAHDRNSVQEGLNYRQKLQVV